MPRIRTVKPEFWTDEKLVECSLSARLMFIGMFNFSDDNGNLVHSSKRLKMQIFPADLIDVEPLLNELITHELLSEYSVNEKKYIHINGFKKHQKINRPSKSTIPEPDFNLIENTITEHSLTEEEEEEEKEKEKEKEDPSSSGQTINSNLMAVHMTEEWMPSDMAKNKARIMLFTKYDELNTPENRGEFISYWMNKTRGGLSMCLTPHEWDHKYIQDLKRKEVRNESHQPATRKPISAAERARTLHAELNEKLEVCKREVG